MESIEVKISRPIHGEAGPFRLYTNADGTYRLRIEQLANPAAILVENGRADIEFTAAEFEAVGTLLARFRKARGRTAKPGAKKTTRKRTTKPTATAPEATPAANGESY